MRIGIMTYWCWDNYGSILQCYALQMFLKRLGHSPFLIRYDPRKDMRSCFIRRLVNKIRKFNKFDYFRYFSASSRYVLERRKKIFESFIDKRLNVSETIYNSYVELKKSPPPADCYIAGSDQIWSQRRSDDKRANTVLNDAYMLNFGGHKVKKLAYSVSWGGAMPEMQDLPSISKLLNQFYAISTREIEGVEACKLVGFERVTTTPDPVFLLDTDHYMKIARKPNINVGNKFVLVYYLSNKSCVGSDLIELEASKRGNPIVMVRANDSSGRDCSFVPTPEEWLWLIQNADYVITNSYHCLLFSLMFNKRYDYILREGESSAQNQRVRMLTDGWGLDVHLVNNPNDLFSHADIAENYKTVRELCRIGRFFLEDTLKKL